MRGHWKQTLVDYVRLRSRFHVVYRWEDDKLVQDERYHWHTRRLAERLSAWHRKRSVEPLDCQSRLKLLQTEKNGERISAMIQIRSKLTYLQHDFHFDEERIEIEKLELRPASDNRWVISKVIRDLPEKASFLYYPPRILSRSSSFMITESVGTVASQARKEIKYHRHLAKDYANRWWDQPNPEFISFDVDCTNFVSQCLYAGGAPINYTGKRENGWWYKSEKGNAQWSFSWSVAHSLQLYLLTNTSGLVAERVDSPKLLQIGDCIMYDWDGDGRFQHSTIVTGKDAAGMPLVNARSTNSKMRYWDYRDSPAWSARTIYRFFHIRDMFSSL